MPFAGQQKRKEFEKVCVINAEDTWREKMLENGGADFDMIDSSHCIVRINEKGTIEMFHKGRAIDLETTYFFIRGKVSWQTEGKPFDTAFLAIISHILHFRNVEYTSPVYRYHSYVAEKMFQAVFFALHDVPHPANIICHHTSYCANEALILSSVSFPCVLKSAGDAGVAVWKVESTDELKNKLKEIQFLAVIQEYIPNTHDTRVVVFEDEVIGGQTKASIDGFYNHVSKGAIPAPTILTDEEEDVSLRAARATENTFCGVDIVDSERGVLVLEVNRNPGVKEFETDAKVSVTEILVNRLKKKLINH